MMFRIVLRVIGTKVKVKWCLAVFGKNRGLTPWDLGQNFKFAKTFCIVERSSEMMFGIVLRVIGSKVEAKWCLAVCGQKPWTNPLRFGSKFQICRSFLYS